MEIIETLNWILEVALEWIWTNKLKLNPKKMEVILVGGRFDMGFKMLPILGGLLLHLKEWIHILRVLSDPALLLDNKISAMARNIFYQL